MLFQVVQSRCIVAKRKKKKKQNKKVQIPIEHDDYFLNTELYSRDKN